MDKAEKEIHLWLHGPDREIVEAVKKRHGCSTASAIRACIRIAGEVKLNLVRPPTQVE